MRNIFSKFFRLFEIETENGFDKIISENKLEEKVQYVCRVLSSCAQLKCNNPLSALENVFKWAMHAIEREESRITEQHPSYSRILHRWFKGTLRAIQAIKCETRELIKSKTHFHERTR